MNKKNIDLTAFFIGFGLNFLYFTIKDGLQSNRYRYNKIN